jgi:sugar-specific transcriptional regulator TrmB
MRDILKQLGLTNSEVNTYLAGLEVGPSPIAEIAKKANLPRSSCYLIIQELIKKGFFSTYYLGKKRLFLAEPPQKLVTLAKDQLERAEAMVENLKNALPTLVSLYNLMPQKPKIRFYEGFEGIKTIFEETLEAKQILVLCSGYKKPMERQLFQYMSLYFHKVLAQKIPTFEIIGDSPDSADYQRECSSSINKIKIVPHAKDCTHIDKTIFQNKIAIISFPYLNGVIIENKPIADYEKALFWQLWESLEVESK